MPDRTKKTLADALRNIMITKPLQKITIQEIVGACGLNRQTFYYHFHDIYDLLHWMFEHDAQHLLETRLTTDTWAESLLHVLYYLEENKQMCICALQGMQAETLNRFLYMDVEPVVRDIIDQRAEEISVEEQFKTFVTHFYTLSISAIIMEWLSGKRKDLQIPPEELVRLIDVTLCGNLKAAMLRYRDELSNDN